MHIHVLVKRRTMFCNEVSRVRESFYKDTYVTRKYEINTEIKYKETKAIFL